MRIATNIFSSTVCTVDLGAEQTAMERMTFRRREECDRRSLTPAVVVSALNLNGHKTISKQFLCVQAAERVSE